MRPPGSTDDDGNRIPNTTMAVVARELALRLVDPSFRADAEHTLRIGHVVADKLSRVYAPAGPGVVRKELRCPQHKEIFEVVV